MSLVDARDKPSEGGVIQRLLAPDAIFHNLKRYILVISGISLLTFLLVWAGYTLVPAKYEADVVMLHDDDRSNVIDIESVISTGEATVGRLASEVAVVTSTSLLGRVVRRLQLESHPEFVSTTPMSTLGLWQHRLSIWIGRDGQQMLKKAGTHHNALQALKSLRNKIDVKFVPRTQLMSISVTTGDRALSVLVANTVANTYLTNQLEVGFSTTRRANDWLTGRVSELEAALRQSESLVQEKRKEAIALSGQDASITSQQIAQISNELLQARGDLARAELRYRQIQNRASSGQGLALADVQGTDVVSRLLDRREELQKREAELSSRYLELHPKLVKVRQELVDLQARLQEGVSGVVTDIEAELGLARGRVGRLQATLNRLEARAEQDGRSSIELRQLERDVEANRRLYEEFLGRYKEVSIQDDFVEGNIQILRPADEARKVHNRGSIVSAFASVVAFIITLGFCHTVSSVHHRIRTPEESESLLGIRTLGTLSHVGEGIFRADILAFWRKNQTSEYFENVRSLASNLRMSGITDRVQVIAVTSSIPNEGKTTLSIALSLVTGSPNHGRTLLVDADLKKPSATNRIAQTENMYDLLDGLSGTVPISSIVTSVEGTGVDYIAGHQLDAESAQILQSKQFESIIEWARGEYQYVVIDTPPVMAVMDTVLLSRIVDRYVFVAKWNSTDVRVAARALQHLKSASAKVAGVVLNGVKVGEARSEYGTYGLYAGRYADYYKR